MDTLRGTLWQAGLGLFMVLGFIGGMGKGWAYSTKMLAKKKILSTDTFVLNLHYYRALLIIVYFAVKWSLNLGLYGLHGHTM